MNTKALATGIVVVLALAAFVAYADPIVPVSPLQPGTCVNVLDEWSVPLNLSITQQDQIRSVLAVASGKVAALRADGTLSDTDRNAQIRDISVNTRVSLMDILTPDQRDQATSLFRDKFAVALELTPDQRDKLDGIFLAQSAKIEAIRADKTLTPEQTAAAIKDVHAAAMGEIKPILTPDQIGKLPEWRREHSVGCVPTTTPK